MSFLSSDGVESTDASALYHGPLRRVSDNVLNALDVQKGGSRKRKYCTESTDIELGESINIQVKSCQHLFGVLLIMPSRSILLVQAKMK